MSQSKPIEYLSRRQWKEVQAAVSSPRDRLLLYILYETGCTVTELIELKTKDIQFSTSQILIGTRAIPLKPQTLALLEQFLAEHKSNFLFSSRESKKITKARVRQILAQVSQNAETSTITPQVLRYTHMVHAALSRIPITTVLDTLGMGKSRRYELITLLTQLCEAIGYDEVQEELPGAYILSQEERVELDRRWCFAPDPPDGFAYMSQTELTRLSSLLLDQRDHLLVHLFLETGCTVKELLALQKQDISFSTKTLHFHKRSVEISQALASALEKYSHSHDSSFLFVSQKQGQISPNGLRQILARIGAEQSIAKLTPRALRNSHIIQRHLHGEGLHEVLSSLGLSSSRIAEIIKILGGGRK